MNFFYKRVLLNTYRCHIVSNCFKISSNYVHRIPMTVRTVSLSSYNFNKVKKTDKKISPPVSHHGLKNFETVFQEAQELSDKKWEEIIEFGRQSIPQLDQCVTSIMRECKLKHNFNLAFSFTKYVRDKGIEQNTGFLSLFLEMYGRTEQECDENVILEMYRKLEKQLPIKSQPVYIKVINALCRTSQYHLIYPHLEGLKTCGAVPPDVNYNMTVGAFRTGHNEDAWQLLEEVLPAGLPLTRLVSAFVLHCNTLKKEERRAAVVRFLERLQFWQIFLDEASLVALGPLMADIGWAITPTAVNALSGKCRSCGDAMAFSDIPPDAFARLTDVFLERVVRRSDIYLSTSPTEWQKFEHFLLKECPFTHVIDGLNVTFRCGRPMSGHSKSSPVKKTMMQSLLGVVEQMVAEQPDAKPLVICRAHMFYWHRTSMDKISKIASVYSLENMSADDSFFLYAALRSGIDTQIITCDMLRNHAFLLQDIELQRIFKLWQQRAQRTVVTALPLKLRLKRAFTTTCQPSGADGRSWHIPYDDGSLEQSYDLPRSWLCAKWGGDAHSTAPEPLRQGQTLTTNKNSRIFSGLESTLKSSSGAENRRKQKTLVPGPRIPVNSSSKAVVLEQVSAHNLDQEKKSDVAVAENGTMKEKVLPRKPSVHLKSSTIVTTKLKGMLSSYSSRPRPSKYRRNEKKN